MGMFWKNAPHEAKAKGQETEMKAFLIANIVFGALTLIANVALLVLKKDWNYLEAPIETYVVRSIMAATWIIWASILL